MLSACKISLAPAMLAALALGACRSGPQTDAGRGVDFVQGCWVQKQAFGLDKTVFLRLLPTADGSAYEGQLSAVSDNTTEPGGRVSFARDGATALFFLDEQEKIGGSGARAPEPPDWPAKKLHWRAFFTPQPEPLDARTEYLVAEGDDERLIITVTDSDHAELLPLLDLQRDGCD